MEVRYSKLKISFNQNRNQQFFIQFRNREGTCIIKKILLVQNKYQLMRKTDNKNLIVFFFYKDSLLKKQCSSLVRGMKISWGVKSSVN